MTWNVVYIKHAQKDARKLASSGLKIKAIALIEILKVNPFQNPPRHES